MNFACETPPAGNAAAYAEKFTVQVPVIATGRLNLRAPRVADFSVYSEIVCSARGRFVGGPMSREDAWFDFAQLAAGWMLHGCGGWTICHSSCNGDAIGFAILGFEPGDLEIALGYLLAAEFEGSGYATEAVLAVRDWAFATYGWTSLVSFIAAENIRSISLANRIGATRDTTAERALAEEHDDMLVYRHHAV